METGFPLVLLLGPLVAAAVAFGLRRHRRASMTNGLITIAVLSLLLWLAAPGVGLFSDNSVLLNGRELVLTPFVRSLFLFIYPALGVLFVVSWFRPAGQMLIPAGLAILSPLAAGLMVSPISLGAVFMTAAAAVVVPVLHGGRYEAASVTWRYFLMMTLALAPALLIASLPAGGATSSNWISLLLAALILLGGFPFHIWAGGLGRHSPPAALALVLGLLQIVVVVFVLNLVDGLPAARMSIQFQTVIRWSAVLTAIVAVLQMGRVADWGNVVAGVTLFDMGFLLLATLAPGAGGLIIALPALISRYLSLLLITLGLSRLPINSGLARSLSWRALLPSVALIYGCLSLLGLPFTPGFAGRWAQVAVAGQGASIWPPALLVAALTIGSFVILRAIVRLMGVQKNLDQRGATSSRSETVLILLLLGTSMVLGLFPDLVVSYVSRILGVG